MLCIINANIENCVSNCYHCKNSIFMCL